LTDDEVVQEAVGLGWRLERGSIDGQRVYQWRCERWGQCPAFVDRGRAILWMHDWLGRAGMA
jgi:hypothetical protein